MDDDKLIDSLAQLAMFNMVYQAHELLLILVSIGLAWAFFGWKLAIVVILIEWRRMVAYKRNWAFAKFTAKVESGMT